jgi:dihydroorotate dehydrogenase subfamily 2
MFYKRVIRPILFKFDPEGVHNFFILIGEFLGSFEIFRKTVGLVYGGSGKYSPKIIDGISYKSSVILAAGFDYNGRLTRILPYVGFGGEEVGSVTARPCKGNGKPRLKRLVKSQSILVNKGLANDGVEKIINRLKKTKREKNFVIGVSIARTNDPDSVSVEAGVRDYIYSFKRLNEENIGDYYTINISCPNAFGGESFAEPGALEQLFDSLDKIHTTKPIYIKMPINLKWEKFEKLLDITASHRINGFVIGNLNKDYNYINPKENKFLSYQGGLSGRPCRDLSTELIKKTRQKFGNKYTIIGCGGIMSTGDAREKLGAGADLVQLITGMIYEGPELIKQIKKSVNA